MSLKIVLQCFVLVALISSCATREKEQELVVWKPKLYVVDPVKSAIVRTQSAEFIECKSEGATGFICMPEKDLLKLYEYCLAK